MISAKVVDGSVVGMQTVISRLLQLCVCITVLASPLVAQTVELSTRVFWLGERPATMESDTPFIAVREIDWIEAILSTDPILQDAVVHIELTFQSGADFVAASYKGEVLLGPDRLPSKFNLSDYRIYGSPVVTAKSFTYVPFDPAAGFRVRCSQRDDVEHILLCVVCATYPPDDRIRLTAALYFPPDPADAPSYFRQVAERMREVAYCLDVTDERPKALAAPPKLSGCRPKPTS
ncbi:hypothetical protein [Cypionkella sp. TWP1-2-1b2]|uniref:hypothetical protein n=1 Tax=Cypionkella sp. TWP1-2-1b2 TaxID=2804675 RepID=UPI003CF27178